MLKFDVESYLSYVEMSSNPRLLVEGYSDKTALSFAISHLIYDDIDIDTAEDLISSNSALGNRQKVELMCRKVRERAVTNKFIGLADREFRGFKINGKIHSELLIHHESDNLFWTLGHSIENYVFSKEVISTALKYVANSPNTPKAIDRYIEIFPSALTVSTALTLALYDKEYRLRRVTSIFCWDTFIINGNDISIDLSKLDHGLKERNFIEEERSELINEYLLSLDLVKSSDRKSTQCFCHGHLGIKMIKLTFARCLHDYIDDRENINSVFLNISERDLFITLINVYYDLAAHDGTTFPSLMLDRLANR